MTLFSTNLQRKSDVILKQMKRELKGIQKSKQSVDSVQKSREKRLEDLKEEHEETSFVDKVASGQLIIPQGVRLGNKVISVKDLSMGYDDQPLLFSDLSFEMQPGDIIGIVGKNGCGKVGATKTLISTF